MWLQYWAELPTLEHRERYQRFVDNYVTDQKRYGRFPRPLNNRIVDVDEWLRMWDVVGDETRIQVAVALMFLLVCILNTFGLMLAKFLKAAPISGLRRALGASRMDVDAPTSHRGGDRRAPGRRSRVVPHVPRLARDARGQ